MKRSSWLMLALFAALAAGLRVWQGLTGFEESGLAISGNLPGTLLPLLFAASAAYFIAAARRLPARCDTADVSDSFRFQNMAAAVCAVAGAFLLCGGAVMGGAGQGLIRLLLAVFAAAAAFSVLYTVFALYRGNEVQGVALLVPVCFFMAYLIIIYRADTANPVLASVYVELLAVAALTLSSLERASFAFRSGAPRAFVPAGATAAVLAFTAAAERKSLAAALFFLGCALVETAFLAAADFQTRDA